MGSVHGRRGNNRYGGTLFSHWSFAMNGRTDIPWSHFFGSAQSGSPPTLWRAFTGFGLWAVCFTVLYTAHALACTWIMSPSGDVNALLTQTGRVTWLLVAIWVFFVLWLV